MMQTMVQSSDGQATGIRFNFIHLTGDALSGKPLVVAHAESKAPRLMPT
jgi:hypothetical protein